MSRSDRYRLRLRVQGELPRAWSAAFADLDGAAQPDGTTLISGELADQAALHGLLDAVRDFGLALKSVEAVAVPSSRSPAGG